MRRNQGRGLGLLMAAVLAITLQPDGAPRASGGMPSPTSDTAHTGSNAVDQERPDQISPAAWTQMIETIQLRQYGIRIPAGEVGRATYQAHNPAHGLVAVFTEDNIRVQPSRGETSGWELTLRLLSFGYEGSVEPLEMVDPVAEGNRVEYRRGALTEWYVNEPRGLEQGFTVAVPPAVGGSTRPKRPPLVLELQVTGLEVRQERPGESLLLTAPDGGSLLRYHGLVAWDADGAKVPAEMSATKDGIRIEVDDAGANYPLTIDPFIEGSILRASDAAPFDSFGAAVAISGDTVVVGASAEDGGPGDPLAQAGAAYVFERDHGGVGNWGEVKRLAASDPQVQDQFGISVAVSLDTVLVGAYGEDGGPGDPLTFAGAVYVFERDHGGIDNWGQVKRITASDAGEYDYFGFSLSISGDTAIVGAYGEAGGPNDPLLAAGAAYVFERNLGGADNWGEVTKLTASDAQADDIFGVTVAISGDLTVVGAIYESGGPGDPLPGAGAAYIFHRNRGGADTWGQVTKLTASDAQPNDFFGEGVAISGSAAVVGAWQESGGAGDPATQGGAAYVFARDWGGFGNWGEVKKLTSSDLQANDSFGRSVGISSNTVVVGASVESGGPGDPISRAGAAYVFERGHGGLENWGEARKLTASDAQAQDGFGWRVAIWDDTAIVAASAEDGGSGNPLEAAGAAYVFDYKTWAYVLDGYGGLHAAGPGVVPITPPPPYFGFDIARDVELVGDGAYVLDGYGGVHAAGGAPAIVPAPPYFGIDAAVDLELASAGGAYVMDSHYGVHEAGGAPPTYVPEHYINGSQAPCWGPACNPGRDLELAGTGFHQLVGFGGVPTWGGVPGRILPPPPYFGFNIARDLELVPGGGAYVLEGFGGVHPAGGAPPLTPATIYWGWDAAMDMELDRGGGYYVLDSYGGLHAGGGAAMISPAPPYFGFPIARDLELR